MIETHYHSDWQRNRIDFILSKYPKEFFKGKRVLELGAFNGYIGSRIAELGADVLCLEGRLENVFNIQRDYPNVKVELANLDTDVWRWGHWDIIINFGLFYHLENHHKEHMKNCLDNCDMMLFETVVFNSDDNELYVRNEHGDDQSLTDIAGTPSTSYVENLFNESNVIYEKFTDSSLNGNKHHYDWADTNTKVYDGWARRFWIVKK